MSVAEKFRALRVRSGLSLAKLAREMGYKGASSIQRYEDPAQFKKEYLPRHVVDRAISALEGLGDPPILRSEVLELAGAIEQQDINIETIDRTPQPRHINQIYLPQDIVAVKEFDVQASAGAGRVVEYENEAHFWAFPRDFTRQLQAAENDLAILTVEGDSLVSTPASNRDIEPGDKVVVRITDKLPTPPGYFVIHDGLGVVAKRVEHIPNSEPAAVRISSNNPAYPPYERTLDEAYILGRIVGRWQRL